MLLLQEQYDAVWYSVITFDMKQRRRSGMAHRLCLMHVLNHCMHTMLQYALIIVVVISALAVVAPHLPYSVSSKGHSSVAKTSQSCL
jgi:hypothetical protein